MKFLLNSKIQIFSLTLKEALDGALIEERKYLGSFFCSVKLESVNEENHLTIITREHQELHGRLEIIYDNTTYSVIRIKQISNGFLKLLCK